MKYINTMTYYYTNVKSRLEKISVPNDILFEKSKETILNNLDMQLSSSTEGVSVMDTVSAMISVLSKDDYPYRNKIYDPAIVSNIQELSTHLNIMYNIYVSEANVEVSKEEVIYERLPNPKPIIKNGVMAQYEEKLDLPARIPNIYK